MPDFNEPTNSTHVNNILSEIRSQLISLAKLFDGTSDTNIPDDTIRWNSATKRFEVYDLDSGTWSALCDEYNINVTKLGGHDIDYFVPSEELVSLPKFNVWNSQNRQITPTERWNTMLFDNTVFDFDNSSDLATTGRWTPGKAGNIVLMGNMTHDYAVDAYAVSYRIVKNKGLSSEMHICKANVWRDDASAIGTGYTSMIGVDVCTETDYYTMEVWSSVADCWVLGNANYAVSNFCGYMFPSIASL